MDVEQLDFVSVPTRDVPRAVEDSGVCHMGFVKDPDGNVLILHRRYAPKVRRGES
jgi:hypothetical protein